MFTLDSLDVLDYIRQSVEILMNMKCDEQDLLLKNKQLQDRLSKKKEQALAQARPERNITASRFVLETSLSSSAASLGDVPHKYEKLLQ